MTQRELGIKLGFSERTAVIRVGQYETEKRKPKQDMVDQLARIFDVASESISVPEIDNYTGLMHTLFTLEDRYGLTVTTLDGQVCLKQDINHPNYDVSLAEDLMAWRDKKDKLTSGSILVAEYDHWRYNYPKDKTEETMASLDALREKKNEDNND